MNTQNKKLGCTVLSAQPFCRDRLSANGIAAAATAVVVVITTTVMVMIAAAAEEDNNKDNYPPAVITVSVTEVESTHNK